MKFLTGILLTVFLTLTACNGQITTVSSKKLRTVGGNCEGCEALLEYGDKKLSPIDTLPLFTETEPKLKLTGTVFQKDGKTPASDIILYIYHTDRKGIYATLGNETGWAKRHGFIRGWIKTNQQGIYTFYTFRPASYPDGSEPEHVHLTVKEPDTIPYYLDDYFFADDPLLQSLNKKRHPNRGGNGIVEAMMENNILTVTRDIILGLNIPDYE